MALQPSIILAGRTPDIVGSMARGQAAGAQTNDIQQQRQFRNALAQYGAGAVNGDQQALNALAAFDPAAVQGLQQGRLAMDATRLGMDATRLNMDATRLGMDHTRQQMRILDEQQALQVQEHFANMTAAEREADIAADEQALRTLMGAQSPEQWDALAQSMGKPEYVGQFSNRQPLLFGLMDAKDIAAAMEGEGPQSSLGQFYADVEAGFIPEGTQPPTSGVNVTTNVGGPDPNAPQIGTIPQGYQALRDPETGGYVYQAIPGGPEDTSTQDALRQGAADTSSTVIANAFTRALDADGQRFLRGVFGQLASVNPSNANAEVYRQVSALKNIASAEALNAMRQQSPTGGALGNVTEKELVLLSQQAGALDPASPNFQRDLADYTLALLETIHGVEGGRDAFARISGQEPPQTPQAQPAPETGLTAEDMQYLGLE